MEGANYCLNCKVKPCSVKGCPLQNNIPEFIQKLKEEDYSGAYKVLSQTTVLPGICGRICPHKKQCQGACVRGIKGEPVSIGRLEALVFDKVLEQNETLKQCWEDEIKQPTNKKVAVIGGGPARTNCSSFFSKRAE